MSWPAHFLVGLAGALSHVRYTHEGRRAARQILEDGPGRLSLTSSSTVAGPSSSLPPCRDCGKRDGGEGRERRRSARNPPPATAGASSGGDNSEADGYAPCPVCGGTGKRPVDADLMELPRGMVAAAAQTPELRVVSVEGGWVDSLTTGAVPPKGILCPDPFPPSSHHARTDSGPSRRRSRSSTTSWPASRRSQVGGL